jgi:hypothetical protein
MPTRAAPRQRALLQQRAEHFPPHCGAPRQLDVATPQGLASRTRDYPAQAIPPGPPSAPLRTAPTSRLSTQSPSLANAPMSCRPASTQPSKDRVCLHMTPTRRTVLLAGLVSIAALGAGTVTLGLRGTTRIDVPSGLVVFSDDEYSILSAIADTLHPGSSGLPTGTVAGVPVALDHIVSTMNPADQDEFRQALGLIENALVGALLDQRTTTFTGSSPAVRTETLRGRTAVCTSDAKHSEP